MLPFRRFHLVVYIFFHMLLTLVLHYDNTIKSDDGGDLTRYICLSLDLFALPVCPPPPLSVHSSLFSSLSYVTEISVKTQSIFLLPRYICI